MQLLKGAVPRWRRWWWRLELGRELRYGWRAVVQRVAVRWTAVRWAAAVAVVV